ncbi:MAG: BolA family transcriptional regulator [Gammaproteobacteria bacterium]|nr:BolA family transcriptional regulator [Gammaproteobacteria bacterium]
MQNDEIKDLIVAGIPGASVTVSGDDGTHFETLVISEQFKGKSMVQQHQMIYRALGQKMGKDINALSIQTITPEEWESKKGLRVL